MARSGRATRGQKMGGGGQRGHRVALMLVALVAVALALVPSPARPSASAPLASTNYDAGDFGLWRLGEQVKDPGRIEYVSNSERGRIQRVEVWPGDNNVVGSGDGERAHVWNKDELSATDGQTFIGSWSTFIGRGFASPSRRWNSFTTFHASGGGNQAVWKMHLVGDAARLRMNIWGGGQWTSWGQPAGSVSEWFSLGSLPKNRWNDFVVEIRFGCTGNGYVKLWLNGSKLVDATNRKIGYCGDPRMYWKQGFYRSPYNKVTRLWFDDTFRWPSTAAAFAHYGWKRGSSVDLGP